MKLSKDVRNTNEDALVDMKHYEKATGFMASNKDAMQFNGPHTEALVQKAEAALGLVFQQPYRRFLLELGSGAFGGFEVYGLVRNHLLAAGASNGIWFTLDLREHDKLPANMIIIGSDGMGNVICLRNDAATSRADVVLFAPGLSLEEQDFEVLATGFGEYFLEEVSREVNRLETMKANKDHSIDM